MIIVLVRRCPTLAVDWWSNLALCFNQSGKYHLSMSRFICTHLYRCFCCFYILPSISRTYMHALVIPYCRGHLRRNMCLVRWKIIKQLWGSNSQSKLNFTLCIREFVPACDHKGVWVKLHAFIQPCTCTFTTTKQFLSLKQSKSVGVRLILV